MNKPDIQIQFGQEFLEGLKIHKNLDQEIIVTTVDKAKLCLIENRDLLHHQREWLTPFGLLVAIVTTLVASTFQDFGMDAAVWEALYVLGGLASVTWLWITGWQAWKLRSQGGIDEIVKTLKISVVVE